MTIGINICGSVKEDGGQPINFIIEQFNTIAIEHPEHNFVFVTDRGIENEIANVKDATVIAIDKRPRNTFFWKFWYDYALDKKAKKQKIELLIHLDAVCSLKSKIGQFFLIDDLPTLHETILEKNNLQFYKKNAAKFLQKANKIAVTSEFFKKEIVDKYKINEKKIDVVYGSIDKKFAPIVFEKKEILKEKYTEGKEYFLYAGEVTTEKNWINLLKAFSFFKKRQKSNMQLLLILDTIAGSDFTNSFKTYKYREEVKILSGLSLAEKAEITASAYAFVYPSLYEVYPSKLIEAMQCGTPVIASNIKSIMEIGGDAVLYVNPNSFEDIADKMMLLFKDENKRNELIIKGSTQALHYSIEKSTHVLWQSIMKTTPA